MLLTGYGVVMSLIRVRDKLYHKKFKEGGVIDIDKASCVFTMNFNDRQLKKTLLCILNKGLFIRAE